MLTCSYLPTKLQAMLLLFNKSESLECAKVVVLKLGAILFYSGIHFKPLQLWKKKKIYIYIYTYREDLNRHIPQKDKRIRLVGTCRKAPLVSIFYLNTNKCIFSLKSHSFFACFFPFISIFYLDTNKCIFSLKSHFVFAALSIY